MDRQRLFVPFDFFRMRLGWTIVGDGGSENRDGAFGQASENGAAHFFGGTNADALDACGRFQIYRAADERDFRAAARRGFADGVTHFAGGTIRQIAHGIEVFASGPGGNQNCLVLQIFLRVENFAHGGEDLLLAGEPARASHPAGKIAFIGIDDFDAACAEHFDIFLRRGVVPHVDIHRGSDNDRSCRGEIERGEKIVGDALGEFRENIGCRGGDEKKVSTLSHRDVLDGALHVGVAGGGFFEEIGDDFLPTESGEGERSDKFPRAARHDDLHGEAVLLEKANQFGSFIGRDAAGYA